MAALLLLLAGCGGLVQLAYNQAPTLAYYRIDSYFDFDAVQEQRVRADLAALHQWHRRSELPGYADWLKRLQSTVRSDITAAQVCSLLDEARGKFERVAAQADAAVVATARSLKPEQIERMKAKFAENNKTFRKDWLSGSAAEQAQKRSKRFVSQSEYLYESLSTSQAAAVQRAMLSYGYDSLQSLREIERRHQDAVTTLTQVTQTSDGPKANELMRSYIERSTRSPDAAYRVYAERMASKGCELFAAVHNLSSPEQRQTAATKLGEYELQLRQLATQSAN